MFIFLFLVIVIVCFYLYYTFNDKYYDQQKQIMLLKKQNIKLKNSIQNTNHINKNIKVKFIPSDYEKATTKKDCDLFLSPTDNSTVIYNIKPNELVNIYSAAEVSNTLWFEISIFSKGMINTKGWVKKDFLNIPTN